MRADGAAASSAAGPDDARAGKVPAESKTAAMTTPSFRTAPCRIRIGGMSAARANRPKLSICGATLAMLLAGCDKAAPLADLDTGAPQAVGSATAPNTSATLVPAPLAEAAAPAPARSMPPRPVPTTAPTVTIGMPMETQLQAIQYMQAMQAPQPGEAAADPTYARQIADALRGLGKTDVISSGRLIEIKMEKGCDATLPKQAIARSTAATLGVLLAHGVLVIKCLDRQVQCLQSTRDADDVLCTHK